MKKLKFLILLNIFILNIFSCVFAKHPSEWIWNESKGTLTYLIGTSTADIKRSPNQALYVIYYKDPVSNQEKASITVNTANTSYVKTLNSLKQTYNDYDIKDSLYKQYGKDNSTGVIFIYTLEITKKEVQGPALPEGFKYYKAKTKVNSTEYSGESNVSAEDALKKLKTRLQSAFKQYYEVLTGEDNVVTEMSGYYINTYYDIIVNGKTYNGKTGKDVNAKSSSSGGSTSSAKASNNYPTISLGTWKGSEGSYWFDQGNGQYPSGNKWYYITTNGGAPGWENYYYWFDNEGYWRPQYYSKNDPSQGYQTWGSGSSTSNKSSQTTQSNQSNNYQPSVPQQDNRNIQVLQNVEEKGSSEVGDDLLSLFNKQQSEYKSGSSNFSTSQNNSTPLTPNNSISINNQSNIVIPNPSPSNNTGNTNNSSNISNNADTSEIDELFDDGKFTGESYKSKTAVLTKQDNDEGQNWQWDNFEDNGWKPYTVNQKTTEGTGVWIQWGNDWYFATNTENKLTWSDENKSEQTKGLKGSGSQYVISELINEGTYAIDKKLYTFDDNGKLLSSPNGMSGSKGLIQLNTDGSIKSGHEISMDDSESSLKVYDKSEFESTGTKYILEKEDSKNYKVLGNGYFILKKTDTSYSLINATSPLNAKAISSAGTSLSKINEYLKKNGSSYEEAEEVEVVNGSISNSGSSSSSKTTNTSTKTYTTATTTNYTSVNNLLGAVNNSQVNSDGELSLSLKDKTFLSNGKYYNNVDNKTYTLNEDGEITNIQTGNLGGTAGTYEIVQIGNVKFLVK